MIDNTLVQYMADRIGAGQLQLAGMIRTVIEGRSASMAALLEPDDIACCLEPLLFADTTSTQPGKYLDGLLYGLIPAERRPHGVDVVTDNRGVLYLPGIGSLETSRPNRRLHLAWKAGEALPRLLDEDGVVDAGFSALPTTAGGAIGVLEGSHPLLDRFFVDAGGIAVDVDTINICRSKRPALTRAFEVLQAVHPLLYDVICSAVRTIVLFHADGLNSFAALPAHGAAFLNTSDDDDEVFFIEDIPHQCGHVIFNAVTFETERFLAVPAQTPLRGLTGNEMEDRTVYDAFHGVFTEAVMYQCMSECRRQCLFDGRRMHELQGRLGLLLQRFTGDLTILARYPVFTEEGTVVFSEIVRVFKSAYESCWDVTAYEYGNQPYNFSYEKFAEANGDVVAGTTGAG